MPDGLAGQVHALVQLLLAEEGREVWETDVAVAHRIVRFTFQGVGELKARGRGIGAAVAMLGPGISQVALSQELRQRLRLLRVLLHAGKNTNYYISHTHQDNYRCSCSILTYV